MYVHNHVTYIHVHVYIHCFITVYILLTSVGAAGLGTLLCGQSLWILYDIIFHYLDSICYLH